MPPAPPADRSLARYHLLASAMVNRPVRVEPAEENEPSYSDGQAIYLATGPAAAGGDRSLQLTALTVQAALLAAGSLDHGIMRRLHGRPQVAQRYLAVESWRALVAADDLPWIPVVARARSLGAASSSPLESLTIALGRQAVPDIPPEFGMVRPRQVLATAVEQGGAPTAGDLARQRPEEDKIPEFAEDEETDPAPKLSSPTPQNGLMAALLKMLGGGRQPGSGAGDTDSPTAAVRRTTRPGSKGDISLLPAALLPTETLTDRGCGLRYPEWDSVAGRYRREWCTVVEVDPRPGDSRPFELSPSTDVRRRLARLGVGLQRHRRQQQGDDIDLDAAVESRVLALAGSTPEDGLYVESQRRRRNLAVLVLLDISGSVAEGAGQSHSAHRQQQRAAALLLDALWWLGDRVALYGFRSEGRSAVYLTRVKTFDDPFNGMTLQRLGGLSPWGYTRLGAAIRHSAHVLTTAAGTDRRLLVVLSDGFPYDQDYEPVYAQADARRALAETRRQGIGSLCLTLGATTTPEALTRVFGPAAHASASCLEELAPHLPRLFRRALASADLQRRLAQRHRRDPASLKGVA